MVDLRKPTATTPTLRSSLAASLPSREGNVREFSFSMTDFERVRKLIYQHAGISLAPIKQDSVNSLDLQALGQIVQMTSTGAYSGE